MSVDAPVRLSCELWMQKEAKESQGSRGKPIKPSLIALKGSGKLRKTKQVKESQESQGKLRKPRATPPSEETKKKQGRLDAKEAKGGKEAKGLVFYDKSHLSCGI